MKLIVLCAPPAAGKTTFSKQKESEGFVRISQDDQGGKHLELFKQALLDKKDIIIDRMGFSVKQRCRYLEPAKAAGYDTEIIEFRIPKKESLKRCLERKEHPTVKNSEDANNAVNFFFGNYERPIKGEAAKLTVVDYEKPVTRAIYCDIDNTLSNASHREHHMDKTKGKTNWKAFFEQMHLDPLHADIAEILKVFKNSGYSIVLCSGRPEDYRQVTIDWLEKHKVIYDDLFMRQKKDNRSDTIVKEMLYLYDIQTQYDILFALDDRNCVVEKLRSIGVRVLQVQLGAF